MIRKVDELDIKLLKLLQANARSKQQALSKELGVSEGTIRNRIARLEEEKAILQYSAIVDPKKMGFNAVAYVGINAEPLKFLGVLDELSKIEDIHSLSTCTGEYTIIFEVWKKDAAEINDFIENKIVKIPGISKISPNIVVEQVKQGRKAIVPGGVQTTLALI
ncbi:MAG: Lrp/AsnC family transcriptional regulator [Candidatus Micrarchaeota archaeon]